MINLWNLVFYKPLYNALAFLISHIPGGDVGLAVIILTVVVRFVLYPVAKKSIESQIKLKSLEKEISKIKEIYKDKQEQAKKTFELYKENKVNPFSGCLFIILQLPIIFALYYVFFRGLEFKEDILYSFVHFPTLINHNFLGLIDMQKSSIVLAILAGLTQFIQIKLSNPIGEVDKNDKSFKGQFSKSMQLQMKYFLPVFIGFVAYKVSSAVALYWVTSNIFTIVQEIVIRRKFKLKGPILEVKASTPVENKQ